MTDPTLSTLESIASRLPGEPPITKIRAVAEQYLAGVDAAMADPDLTPQAKQRRVAEREAAALAALKTLQADTLAAALKGFDQSEGAARQALLPPSVAASSHATDTERMLARLATEAAQSQRRAMLADLVADVADADLDEISELTDEVAAYGDPMATTRAYRAAVRRLEALHRDTPEQQRPEIFKALVTAQNALRQHRQAHPGPTRTLRNIERQRGSVTALVSGFFERDVPQLLKLGAATERQARTERATKARAALDHMAGAAR